MYHATMSNKITAKDEHLQKHTLTPGDDMTPIRDLESAMIRIPM